MAYLSNVAGEILISPALNWSEIQGLPKKFKEKEIYQNCDVRIKIDSETEEVEEGQLIRWTSSNVIPAYEDAYKAYRLVEDLEELIDLCAGHSFSGYFEIQGEDGDLSRVYVRDRKVFKTIPVITWPEENQEEK